MKYLLLVIFFLSVSCSHTPEAPPQPEKKSLVFIHGSHFDASAWDSVAPEFSQDPAYQVTLITLKGRQPNENYTLTEIAKDACEKTPAKSVLIGHSFGGVVSNQMVGICPEKIQQIIYVTALVPIKGEKAFDAAGKSDQKYYSKAVQFRKDRIAPRTQNVFLKNMDSGIDLKSLPVLHFYSESYKAGEDKIEYNEATFEQIPKSYIYATRDTIVGLKTQQKYTARTPMAKTDSIKTGHLPMLSNPKELTASIKRVL